ncbi:MAG: tetratricopeptide repeat protein [Planctomycetaceae bacterium]|nr:tetratricopeptide repeat protein [Planctomycetaceae bacterium]
MFTNPEQWYDACVEKQKTGQIDEAIAMLRELVEKFPDYALAYAALGAYYTKKELYDDAVEFCKKYCEKAPDDPFGYSILSSLSIRVGRRQDAEEALMRSQTF